MKPQVYERRPGVWSVVIEIKRTPRQQKWLTVHGTKRQAQAKWVQETERVRSGQYIPPTKKTVGEWLDLWLRDYVGANVRPSTAANYADAIKFWASSLGNIPLCDLTSLQVQSVLSEAASQYHPNTIRHRLSILKQAIKQAVKAEIVLRDPTLGAKPPRAVEPPKKAVDADALKRVVAEAEGTRWYVPIFLAAMTGMRRGETLALRWADIDWERALCRVTASYGEFGVGPPKTKDSQRAVLLDASTMSMLRAEHKSQAEFKLQFGKAYVDRDLVCADEYGSPLLPGSLTIRFKSLAKRAGVDMTFHGLRHTHATLLIEAGVSPKVVAERLGHSDQSFTLDNYVAVTPSMQQEAVNCLNLVLGNRPPSVPGGSRVSLEKALDVPPSL